MIKGAHGEQRIRNFGFLIRKPDMNDVLAE